MAKHYVKEVGTQVYRCTGDNFTFELTVTVRNVPPAQDRTLLNNLCEFYQDALTSTRLLIDQAERNLPKGAF